MILISINPIMSSAEPTKKFVNTASSVVDDALDGLVASTPGVALLKVFQF